MLPRWTLPTPLGMTGLEANAVGVESHSGQAHQHHADIGGGRPGLPGGGVPKDDLAAVFLQSAVDFARQRMIDLGELLVADGMGGQIEQFVAEDFRFARPRGGLGPKALNLRPNGADVPAERLAVLAFVTGEVRPAAGDAGRRDVLARRRSPRPAWRRRCRTSMA